MACPSSSSTATAVLTEVVTPSTISVHNTESQPFLSPSENTTEAQADTLEDSSMTIDEFTEVNPTITSHEPLQNNLNWTLQTTQ